MPGQCSGVGLLTRSTAALPSRPQTAHLAEPSVRHAPRGLRSLLGSLTEHSPERGGGMDIEFLSTVAVIAPDPPASRKLYVDALGLPARE